MKKVLVVDDCASVAIAIKCLLQSNGYDAYVAYSITDAMKIYEMEQPDAVISGIDMNGENGEDLMEKIMNCGSSGARPFLALMSAMDDPLVERVRFYSKPAGIDELLKCLKKEMGE